MQHRRRDVLRLAGLAVTAAVLAGPGRALEARPPGRTDPAGPQFKGLAPRDVVAQARPFTRFAALSSTDRFGSLAFIGGLDLSCEDPRFGGFSALSLSADGELLSLSDRGTWLSGRLATQDGRPVGLTSAVIAPALGPEGRPLTYSRRFDTESLAIVGGQAYVGLERVNEVLRFDLAGEGLTARGQPIPVPPDLKSLPRNKGLEALGMVTSGPLAGRLIGVSEQSEPGSDTPTRGFVLTGGFAEFLVARSDDFDISDLAFLPGGDLLLLERSFSFMTGIRMRIRRVPAAEIRPGALLDGPVLIQAGFAHHIDNMEGLSVHRGPGGSAILTLISDDNFSALQKTVLLQFRLDERTAG
jgi:hypothetical protein